MKDDRPTYYVLDANGEPLAIHDALVWGEWFHNAGEQRIVAKDNILGIEVSTVFLGLDHRFIGDGPPILYETMIFAGGDDEWLDLNQWRYCTREEALRGHAYAVAMVRHGLRVSPTKPRDHRKRVNGKEE
jgi:hypothetical protein